MLTEWSSNQLEMWLVDDLSDPQTKQWLQYTSHDTPPEGQLVLVTDKRELEKFGLEELYGAENMVYENHSGYLVFDYDSYDEMVEQLKTVCSQPGE